LLFAVASPQAIAARRAANGTRSCLHTDRIGELAVIRPDGSPPPGMTHWLRRSEWVVYAKKPFGGPEAVLAYLARNTHRVAISNRRLIAADATDITFIIYREETPSVLAVLAIRAADR
jgi:Putative transposase